TEWYVSVIKPPANAGTPVGKALFFMRVAASLIAPRDGFLMEMVCDVPAPAVFNNVTRPRPRGRVIGDRRPPASEWPPTIEPGQSVEELGASAARSTARLPAWKLFVTHTLSESYWLDGVPVKLGVSGGGGCGGSSRWSR